MGKTPAQRAAKHGSAERPSRPAPGLQSRLYPGTAPSSYSPSEGQRNGNLVLIAGVVAVLFLFWYFHLLTLNQMTQLSGGLAMPDSLIGGYDPAYIESLRNAMNEDARGQLNYLHKTAGLLFPLFFAVVWLLLIGSNTIKRGLRRLLWLPPILFAVIDIWENFAIDALLGATAPDDGAIALASTLTVARWILLGLSVLAALLALILSRRSHHGRDTVVPAEPAR
ncbi:hypothetical protein [Arthrobacter roseus]|uniref:hypothetical protein n=1 Tax=Arthrobacter roseus TaxID=136274 RepID=UPI001964D611|nr:hypothetical protein [Arthrobacter roseus]MBM7847770.1 hypothetical protein [Arthrobacter roseus]